MGYQTSVMHGKYASLFRYRANGFKGVGLNDATWGTGYSGGGSSADFDVAIFSTGTPDTYKFRKNEGAWDDNSSSGYNITGAAQTLSDSQTITFAATTGHTVDDQWSVGNFDTEATTEVTTTAQITTTTHRLCFPKKLTWTDSNNKTLFYEEYAIGKAHFDPNGGNVGTVTVSGNNAYIIPSGLDQIGYLTGWTLNTVLNMADASRCGQHWKEYIPGMASANGTAEALHIIADSFYQEFYENATDVNENVFLLELYFYDASQDQTGDSIKCWVVFNNWGLSSSLTDVVKENVSFNVFGIPSLVEST